MTFYEAALRVLEEAGMPLHSTEITKRAVEKGLLSHVGKTPEITMLSRLAAMAKRPRDRKLQVTDAKDTFALTDWMLPENPEALAATGVQEPNPEEALPPLRPAERHPEAHAEFLRSIGRQNDRKRRDDDRKKKFPPVAEVACEVLQEAQTSLAVGELLARIKQRDGAADDLPSSRLVDGLALDNQKRLDEGRKPLFAAVRSEQNELQISLEPQADGGPTPLEVQTAFCLACKLPFENGRVVLKSEQRQQQAEAAAAPSADDVALFQTARHAGKDARKAMARLLRTKLAGLELGTFEKSCVRMLHALHFRELKVARRSKEGPLMTARRREGSLEIRYAVRVLKGGGTVERRHVQELRRELNQTGANVGLLITAAEARGDARSECTSGPLVMMWAGDALAEKFFEAKVGVSVTTIEIYEIDEAFFSQAKLDADESAKRREERQRERDQRPGSTPPAGTEAQDEAAAPAADQAAVTVPDGVPAVAAAPAGASAEEGDEGDDGEEGDDEGDEGPEGADESAPGAPGEGKRRRRRRRRRRRGGQGAQAGAPRPEGVTVEGAQPDQAAQPDAPPATPPVTLAQPNESTAAEPAPVAPSPSAPPLDPGPSS